MRLWSPYHNLNSRILRRISRSQAGLAFMELVMSMFVASFLLLSATAVMFLCYRNYHVNQTAITVNDDMIRALRQMGRELREAGAASPQGIVVQGPGQSGIRFEIPDAVNPLGPTSWRMVTYQLGGANGKHLLRSEDGSDKVETLATNISSVKFDYDPSDPRLIKIEINGSRLTADGQLISMGRSTQVTVRN